MISLCLIVRDEAEILRSFLDKVKGYVDEIIIVDTGSKDNTKGIAREFTSKVFGFHWCDDFSAARNFSISKASCDWILALDADEVISQEDLGKIREIVKKGEFMGYRLIQETYHNDKLVSTRGICRIFKNHLGIKFVYPIHETVRGSIIALGG
ncbi:MAG: glycosyltransferase family 2 protein, partial [Nanoarchaeota archaeon]|nr:glycosyltransferase family 2 protein [Nanoarchaeota archaeon]